jgi:hypothetical protein
MSHRVGFSASVETGHDGPAGAHRWRNGSEATHHPRHLVGWQWFQNRLTSQTESPRKAMLAAFHRLRGSAPPRSGGGGRRHGGGTPPLPLPKAARCTRNEGPVHGE